MVDKSELTRLRAEVEATLKAKFGDRILMGNSRYTGATMILSVSVAIGDTAEEREARLRREFEQHAAVLGLLSSDFDLPLRLSSGQGCRLIGINPGRPKFPFDVMADDGRPFKVSAAAFLVARAGAPRRDAA